MCERTGTNNMPKSARQIVACKRTLRLLLIVEPVSDFFLKKCLKNFYYYYFIIIIILKMVLKFNVPVFFVLTVVLHFLNFFRKICLAGLLCAEGSIVKIFSSPRIKSTRCYREVRKLL